MPGRKKSRSGFDYASGYPAAAGNYPTYSSYGNPGYPGSQPYPSGYYPYG